MKKIVFFFNIEETDGGEIFWNGFPVEKMVAINLKLMRRLII